MPECLHHVGREIYEPITAVHPELAAADAATPSHLNHRRHGTSLAGTAQLNPITHAGRLAAGPADGTIVVVVEWRWRGKRRRAVVSG